MKKVLLISLILLFAAACDDSSKSSNPPIFFPDIDSGIKDQTEYDNPIFDEVDALGFYDYDRYDNVRLIRNDTTGTLSGMVQFVQTHSVNPNGNAEKNLPLVITEREALLLFTPSNPSVRSISVEIYVDGVLKEKKEMSHPNLMPKSDNIDSKGRPDIIYSRKSWSTTLDWQYVKTGLELKFIDDNANDGRLLAENIEFGAPTEGIFTFLRVGMLKEFPTSGNGAMMTEAARATTEYFQTVPFARLINVTYENVSLPKVILASGVIYDNQSSDESLRHSVDNGTRYFGDMRADVAKSQISIGINLANYGISSATMSQANPQLFFSMVTHLAEGVYANGAVRHGLSGGGGILTLVDTTGNEFSHETGHGYGLGHFPGAVGDDYFWSAHHADSGWGYDAFKKVMRANVHWNWDGTGASVNGVKSNETFKKLYSYNRDAMAGGEAVSGISRYTYHTGYSALRIQNNLTSKAIPSSTSSTGYIKWDSNEKKMKEFTFPEKDKRLKPVKIGVPVFTVIGGYNPDNYTQALLYKPFRGNYGNIFKYAEPNKSSDNKSCWLKIIYKDGTFEEVNVLAIKQKGQYGQAFQLAVNVEEARIPTDAELYCGENNNATKLYAVEFPQNLPPMPKPVIIGKENGFKDAIAYEASILNSNLKKYIGMQPPTLTTKEVQLIKAVGDNLSLYNEDVRDVVKNYFDWERNKRSVSRFIKKYQNDLALENADRVAEFKELLFDKGFIKSNDSLDIKAATLVVNKNKYMAVEAGNVVVKSIENVTENEKWIMDLNGRIHFGADFTQCLTANGYNGVLIISACSTSNQNQFWQEKDGIISLKNNSKQVIDYAVHKNAPVIYNYHGGSNQIWQGMKTSNEPFLATLNNYSIKLIVKLFGEK